MVTSNDRDFLVSQVFKDEACTNLIRGPIYPELLDRCNGEGLFKYATYLDMCRRGQELHAWFIHWRDFGQGTSRYESSLSEMDTLPIDERRTRSAKFMQGVLNSVWLAQKCQHMPISYFDDDLNVSARTAESWASVEQSNEFSERRDVAMNIAARTGHPWAMYSYDPPRVDEDEEYWKSLFLVEPYLVHYWLAIGKSNLSTQDRLTHGFKAFTLKYDEYMVPLLESYLAEFMGPQLDKGNRRSLPVTKVIVIKREEGAAPFENIREVDLMYELDNPAPIGTLTDQFHRKDLSESLDEQLVYPW